MSVRSSLLAILTLGPAYGFQLHSELRIRAPHRDAVNVGQVYATLRRLVDQHLVQPAGTTADGLPLYQLTAAGSESAAAWLGPGDAATADWDEMMDRVLVAASLPSVNSAIVTREYVQVWSSLLDAAAGPQGDGSAALASHATSLLSRAALDWLEASQQCSLDPANGLQRPLKRSRPRRGRPAAGAVGDSAPQIEAT